MDLSSPPIPLDELDLDPRITWVMHCAEGPVPRHAAAAVAAFLNQETRPWTLDWERDFLGLPRRVREQAGMLLGARPGDFTLTGTTTGALTLVAQGLDWQEGGEVLVPLGEFPANAWPWKVLARHGVSLRQVPLWDGHRAGGEALESIPPPPQVDPEARLLDAIGPATRLLSVSWVRFQDGLTLDLARLAAGCRERGVILVVDGIQGAGTRTIDLSRLDGVGAFATGGHKGLLAPQGLGLLWTRDELRRRLTPPGGWLSVEDATDFDRPSTDLDRDFEPGGHRLELGVPNLVGCAALAESLDVLNRAGVERIEAWVGRLRGSLLERLEQVGRWQAEARRLQALDREGRLSSIVALHGAGPAELSARLAQGKERGIHASVREGYLRIAFHGWHAEIDLERLVDWLAGTA